MGTSSTPTVLAVCGSPRIGDTHWLLSRVLEGAQSNGAAAEVFCLAERKVLLCDGCLTCEDSRTCHLVDDMQEAYPKLLSAKVIVFGSPVHFDGVTPHLKNFIDRLNPLCGRLDSKRAAAVTVGRLTGDEGRLSRGRLVDYLRNVCDILGMQWLGAIQTEAAGLEQAAARHLVSAQCFEMGRSLVRGLRRSSRDVARPRSR